jgi:hypothetical protein
MIPHDLRAGHVQWVGADFFACLKAAVIALSELV